MPVDALPGAHRCARITVRKTGLAQHGVLIEDRPVVRRVDKKSGSDSSRSRIGFGSLSFVGQESQGWVSGRCPDASQVVAHVSPLPSPSPAAKFMTPSAITHREITAIRNPLRHARCGLPPRCRAPHARGRKSGNSHAHSAGSHDLHSVARVDIDAACRRAGAVVNECLDERVRPRGVPAGCSRRSEEIELRGGRDFNLHPARLFRAEPLPELFTHLLDALHVTGIGIRETACDRLVEGRQPALDAPASRALPPRITSLTEP